MHEIGRELSGDDRPPLIDDHAQHRPAVRRRLQPRAAERAGRHARGPRSAGPPAAVLRHRRPAVRRRQRERGAVEPGLRAGEHQDRCCRARPSRSPTASSRSSASPPARGGPTASSSGSISPTWPARSTTAASICRARRWARSWPGWKRCRSTTTRSSCPCPTPARPPPTRWPSSSGCPSLEGLIRNRYTGRTFIEGTGSRKRKAETKYTPLREVLEGKRVLLVEDSIVRSTTMKVLLNRIRELGRAREIHVRVACPPIIAPCFYGIDMSTIGELFAPQFLHGRPADRRSRRPKWPRSWGPIRSATCRSNRSPAPSASIADQLCQACITGEYPTPAGQELYQIALKNAGTHDRDANLRKPSRCQWARSRADSIRPRSPSGRGPG